MDEINIIINEILNLTDHYLVRARAESSHYFNEFIIAAQIMKNVMTNDEFENWCAEKMLLKQQTFAEKAFIQYAVETSAARYFAEKHNENFKVEAKINLFTFEDLLAILNIFLDAIKLVFSASSGCFLQAGSPTIAAK